MAPILQCPDCGTKHPLASVPDSGTFPCDGCGRLLKVPEFVPRTARSSAPPAAPAAPPLTSNPTVAAPAPTPPVDPNATQVMAPIVVHNPAPTPAPPPAAAPVLDRPSAMFAPVPLWIRALLWIVAVPLSFVVVFVFARGTGLFSNNQLSDVFLASGSSRFWPVVRLLPFVALLTAILVHAGVYVVARQRGRTRAQVPTTRASRR